MSEFFDIINQDLINYTLKLNTKKDVLIIEDDRILSIILSEYLHKSNFITQVALDGIKGLELIKSNQFDLIITDIGLPKLDGLSLVKKAREFGIIIPIIVITASIEKENELLTFEYGANLFHKKPIDFVLLTSQCNMLINKQFANKVLIIGDIVIDISKGFIKKNNQLIDLTKKEFDLICLFCSYPGYIFSRAEILSALSTKIFNIEEASIDTLVSRLRKKLGSYKGEETIETIFKKGYRLNLNYLN